MEIYNGEQWWEIDATSPELQTGGTRALSMGGSQTGGPTNAIEFANISSTGNFADFGDMTAARSECKSCASRTRAIVAGGYVAPSDRNDIYFVTIASKGDTSTFGLTLANFSEHAALSNETRGIFAGGKPRETNVIQYITIAATGNALDFGDLAYTDATVAMGAASPTRGIIAGGSPSPIEDTINFITISTLGNGADFGNLTDSRYSGGSCSNAVRAVFGG